MSLVLYSFPTSPYNSPNYCLTPISARNAFGVLAAWRVQQGTSLMLRSDIWDCPVSLFWGGINIGISAHSHCFTLNFQVFISLWDLYVFEKLKNFDSESEVFRHRRGYRWTTWLWVEYFRMILFFIFIEMLA